MMVKRKRKRFLHLQFAISKTANACILQRMFLPTTLYFAKKQTQFLQEKTFAAAFFERKSSIFYRIHARFVSNDAFNEKLRVHGSIFGFTSIFVNRETKPSLSLPPLGFQRKQLERVGREKGRRRRRAWEEDQEEVISELRFFCQNKGFRNSNSTF